MASNFFKRPTDESAWLQDLMQDPEIAQSLIDSALQSEEPGYSYDPSALQSHQPPEEKVQYGPEYRPGEIEQGEFQPPAGYSKTASRKAALSAVAKGGSPSKDSARSPGPAQGPEDYLSAPQAKGNTDETRLLALLGKAGNQMGGAIGRTKLDNSTYDYLLGQAEKKDKDQYSREALYKQLKAKMAGETAERSFKGGENEKDRQNKLDVAKLNNQNDLAVAQARSNQAYGEAMKIFAETNKGKLGLETAKFLTGLSGRAAGTLKPMPGRVPSADQAKQAGKAEASYNTLNGMADKVLKEYSGPEVFPTADKAKLVQDLERIRVQLNVAMGQGAISHGDYDRMLAMIPNQQSIANMANGDYLAASLNNLKKENDIALRAAAHANNFMHPNDPEYNSYELPNAQVDVGGIPASLQMPLSQPAQGPQTPPAGSGGGKINVRNKETGVVVPLDKDKADRVLKNKKYEVAQ